MRKLNNGTISVRYFGDATADRVNPDFICDYSGNSPDGGPIELYTIALNVSSQTTCVLFFYAILFILIFHPRMQRSILEIWRKLTIQRPLQLKKRKKMTR